MELIVDYRENKIKKLMPEWIRIDTLTVGDFAIKVDNEIKWVFERKTWKDLSASIKDGRLEEQKKKLLQLNCQVYFIFEGAAFYERETMIAGIEFYKLDAARRKLMMEGIPHIQTKNKEGTVYFLLEFFKQYENFDEKKTGTSEEKIKEKIPVTDEELTEKIWLAISGVGKTLLPSLKLFGLSSILLGSISAEQLAEVKYITSGRKIGEKIAKKILNYDPVAVLSKFPGISLVSAKYICEKNKLSDLLKLSVQTLSEVQKSEKSKIGQKTASKILQLIQFK